MRNKITPSIEAETDNSSSEFLKVKAKYHQASKPLRIKIKPSIYDSSIADNKLDDVNIRKLDVKKQKNHVVKKLDKHYKLVYNAESDDSSINDPYGLQQQRQHHHQHQPKPEVSEPLPNIRIAFSNILSTNENIECAVMKFHNFIHIWSSTKMDNVIIKDTEGRIKIKDYTDFTDKIVGGDITLFNTETGTLYAGIIFVENNKLRFRFTNRPIVPLCTNMKGVILQFNIYIN